ncbi:uncharacterized protein LOC134546356 isoform X1 [Bacillus rossius redtenbacheri]|uniref:uncharacterized protein LOC134546356 isoform X1 n=1 Tax=Bacillus rossius redtenbacheri TaxID=93214 RepID=UPI002FDE89A0
MGGFKVENFVCSEDSWESYAERLEQCFIANGVSDKEEDQAKRRAILISSLGKETYEVLRNLCEPKKPQDVSYRELLKLLSDHYSPKPSVIAERQNFHKRVQQDSETISDFVVGLRKSTRYCNFGTFLDLALRDQFLVGVRDKHITHRLYLESEDITFENAVALAAAYEAAMDNASLGVADLKVSEVPCQTPPVTEAVNVVKFRPRKVDEKGLGTMKCFCCGRANHVVKDCKFKSYRCNNCKQLGHLQRMCPNQAMSKKGESRAHNFVVHHGAENQVGLVDRWESEFTSVFCISTGTKPKPWVIPVLVGEVQLDMEVDSGAAISAISEHTYKQLFATHPLRPTNVRLKSYTNEVMSPCGTLRVPVNVKGQPESAELDLFIVPNGGPPLLGRDWYDALHLPRPHLYHIETSEKQKWELFNSLVRRYPLVFDEGLGTFTGGQVSLRLKENVPPVFLPARTLAFALKSKVDTELDRLLGLHILHPVTFSKWATPIVPVAKSDGSVRICADFKITVNPGLVAEYYPLPRVEELFAKLKGGEEFSTVDLSQAFQQLKLDEASQELCTINTHRGLFRYSRLPFRIVSCPAIFQRTMEQVLQGLDGLVFFQDDVLVTGPTREQHWKNLGTVFQRLDKYGLKVNMKKCKILQPSVTFLGHTIDKEGLHTCGDKVSAVVGAPVPQDLKQLRAWLGLVNYYARFLPNLSTILAPLHGLLKKGCRWSWTSQCDVAFKQLKNLIVSSTVLVHYDPELPIKMACDASPYGLGAVISHVYLDGSEKPIAFASRTLSEAEKNYSQLDREALAIVFGVKKFCQYVYGRKFCLVTDHQPLTHIFGNHCGIPQLAANRLQRWAVLLQGFDYEVQYVRGSANSNADALSRLPLHRVEVSEEFSYLHVAKAEFLPVTAQAIRIATERDQVLSKVLLCVRDGWPSEVEEALKPFYTRRLELILEQGVLMWGHRVVVPLSLQSKILQEYIPAILVCVK